MLGLPRQRSLAGSKKGLGNISVFESRWLRANKLNDRGWEMQRIESEK